MAHRILIVDDDQEFNDLLTDVFEQADYLVETSLGVDAATQRLGEEEFDLVVTDYRMPGRSGVELIARLQETAPKVPVIMVSGYLENGVIRDLIRRGVGGIFMKPLNIFSLLKKTDELIQKSRRQGDQETDADADPGGFETNLPFAFRTFPCRDPHSREFARRVHDLRDFTKNLLMIGETGADFPSVCRDIVSYALRKDHPVFLSPSNVRRQDLFDALEAAVEDGAEQITFVVSGPELLTDEQREIVYQLARQKGPFVALTMPTRFIFCLNRELDHFYDSGLIDEEFYIFLGATELKIPALSEIPEDVPFLAEGILREVAPSKKFEPAARAAFGRSSWPGHVEELRRRVEAVANWAQGSVIRLDEVRSVLEEPRESENSNGENSPLMKYLRDRRDEYKIAMDKLTRHPRISVAVGATQKDSLSNG